MCVCVKILVLPKVITVALKMISEEILASDFDFTYKMVCARYDSVDLLELL